MARRCRDLAIRELYVQGRQEYLPFDLALGRPKSQDLIYRLALARVAQQGAPYSQQRTHNMIEDFDPNWLMLVGIAGATPTEEFTLGRFRIFFRHRKLDESQQFALKPVSLGMIF